VSSTIIFFKAQLFNGVFIFSRKAFAGRRSSTHRQDIRAQILLSSYLQLAEKVLPVLQNAHHPVMVIAGKQFREFSSASALVSESDHCLTQARRYPDRLQFIRFLS